MAYHRVQTSPMESCAFVMEHQGGYGSSGATNTSVARCHLHETLLSNDVQLDRRNGFSVTVARNKKCFLLAGYLDMPPFVGIVCMSCHYYTYIIHSPIGSLPRLKPQLPLHSQVACPP